MKTRCLLLALLLLTVGPLAAQRRQLSTTPASRLEALLQRYSPRLQLAAPAPAAARLAQTNVVLPGRVMRYDWSPAASSWQDPQLIQYAYTPLARLSQETHSDSATAAFTYRLDYTYSATGLLTQTLQQDYAAGAWTNSFRHTTAFDAQGTHTEELNQDWISGTWSTTAGSRYVNTYTAANFLAQQVVQTFNPTTGTFADDFRVVYKIPVTGPYTEFTVQRWSGGQWQDDSRVTGIAWYDAARQLPLSLEVQIPINAAWVSVQRLSATYQPNGNSVTTYELRSNPAGPWQNDSRTTETYDAYANQLSVLNETWDGTAWTLNDHARALLTYDAQHLVLRRDEQLATPTVSGGQFVNQQRFNFGSFQVIVLRARATGPAAGRLTLYPNPASGPARLLLDEPTGTGRRPGEVLNTRGQRVATFELQPGLPGLLPQLPAGIYIVRLSSPQGVLTGRLVQQ